MSLKNLMQYQLRCTTYFNNFIAFCTETSTSNRVILCEQKDGVFKQSDLDCYYDGLSQLKFFVLHQHPVLVLLTQTKIKVYTLEGKILYNHQTPIQCDLAQFEDRFVSCTVFDDALYILSQKGTISKFRDNILSLITQIKSQGVALNAHKNMLLASAENLKIYGLTTKVQEMLEPSTKLPICFIQSIQDNVVLGCLSGELILTKLQKNRLSIICRVQMHIGLMSCLIVSGTTIFTGSEDGFVNCVSFASEKLSLQKSKNLNRLVVGLFICRSRCLASMYECFDLHPI